MKNNVFISTLIALIAISSCSKAEYGNRQEPHESTLKKVGREVLLCDNFVGIDQIKEYADRAEPETKTDAGPGYSVLPYCGADGDTLMYIVNYGKGDGWQILSSDARTPAVIAEGESGCFSVEDGSPAVQVWLDCTAADIAAVRRASDEELSFSAEEIEANRAVWGKGGTRVLPGMDDDGYWVTELVSIQSMTAVEVEHLTPHWAQGAPYNEYCPFKSNSNIDRAPAGCVAVAAAEVLYYLHNTLAVPDTMVSTGSCPGNIYDPQQYFDDYTTTIWSQMSPEYRDTSAVAEAMMIGHIGKVVNMHYNNNYSWALPAHIRTQLFSLYGISASHGSYDAFVMREALGEDMPVIVTATNQLIPTDFNIHCFVIDGYKKTFSRRTYYHYWVPEDPDPWNPKSLPNHDPYYTYMDTTPTITQIKINWGWSTQWGSNPLNDGWYSITPDWTVTNGGSYSYNYNVSMTYDMEVAEN